MDIPNLLVLHASPHPGARVRQIGFALDGPYLEHCWGTGARTGLRSSVAPGGVDVAERLGCGSPEPGLRPRHRA